MENDSHKYWKFERTVVHNNDTSSCRIDESVYSKIIFEDTLAISKGEKADTDLFYMHATANALSCFQKFKIYSFKGNKKYSAQNFKNYIE